MTCGPPLPRAREVAIAAAAALAVFTASGLARLAVTPAGTTLWHPAAAVTLVALVIGGRRLIPAVLVGRVAAGALFAPPGWRLVDVVALSVVVVVPYALVAGIVRRWFGTSIHRAGLRDVIGTIGAAAGAAPLVAGGAWLAVRAAIDRMPPGESASRAWIAYVVSDAVAVLALAPGCLLLVAFCRRPRRTLASLRATGVVGALAPAVAVSATLVGAVDLTYLHATPMLYVAFVPVLWVALRHGLVGVVATALVGVVTTVTFLHTSHLVAADALQIQAFLAVLLGVGYGVGAEVSDRRRAEGALRAAEQRFRTAFDRSMVGMALVGLRPDDRGRFLQVNDALGEMLGLPVDALVGRTVDDVTHPDDRSIGDDAFHQLLVEGAGAVEFTKRYLHADGHDLWCRIRVAVVDDDGGRPVHAVSQIEDVTMDRLRLQRLSYEASHDRLTGLLNRSGFGERARALDRTGTWIPLLYLDLDGFKAVNDTLGHAAGDDVLERVAEELRASVRDRDLVARMGGDEFVVLVDGSFTDELEAHAAVSAVAHRIEDGLRGLEAGGLPVGASIGITVGAPGRPVGDLLRCADQEMLAVKQRHHRDGRDDLRRA